MPGASGTTDTATAASENNAWATSCSGSSATVLLVLQELTDLDGPVVALAFGPGLTLSAALLLPG